MTVKIDSKIVSYEVVSEVNEPSEKPTETKVKSVENKTCCGNCGKKSKVPKRPETLHGSTRSFRSPSLEHACFITLNWYGDMPLEVFIESKDLSIHPTTFAIARMMSVVFRNMDPDLNSKIIAEVASIPDPNGGYFVKSRWVRSVVAHIGIVIEDMVKLGPYKACEDTVGALDEEAGEAIDGATKASKKEPKKAEVPNATLCRKCEHKAVIILDGCPTCTNCGDSKCG